MRWLVALWLLASAGCAAFLERFPLVAGHHAREELAACDAGDRGQCARYRQRVLDGDGVDRDDPAIAAWLMDLCEGGDAQACVDLGALYAAGRGVRRDDGRACDLGLGEACVRAGRPAPASAAAPTLSVEPRGFWRDEAAQAADWEAIVVALKWAETFVPAGDRGPLALTAEGLEDDPPASRADVALVRDIVERRTEALVRCVPVYGLVDGARWPGRAVVEFRVTPEGRTTAVNAMMWAPARADDSAARACITAAVAAWEFPVPERSGRMFLAIEGGGEEELLPAGAVVGSAVLAAPMDPIAPRPTDPACLTEPRLRAGSFEGSVRAKFLVGTDGRVDAFELLDAAPSPVGDAVRTVVTRCRWEPGIAPTGRPAAMPRTLTFSFSGGATPGGRWVPGGDR
jgi:hypothetical protein